MSATIPTVADELRRRDDCRCGLRGVRVADLAHPGQLFKVEGSWWGNRGLLLDLLPADGPQVEEDAVTFRPISSREFAAWKPPADLVRGVPAERCALASPWPACACRLPD